MMKPMNQVPRGYVIYVVGLIWIVLILRTVDLQIISVLLPSVRAAFRVSDTQLGLLTGFAFSLFYGVLGLPIAWLAERFSRKNIIALSVGLWSAMTALCGLSTTFSSLLLSRLGVGVGEAGSTAPAYSLISDYVSERRRITVFAVLNSAVPVGVFIGALVGSYMTARFGWRIAFLGIGAPGIVVASLAYLTMREPPRGHSQLHDVQSRGNATLKEALKYLLGRPSFCHLVSGSSLFTLGSMGSGIWIISFFVRVHHMPIIQVGQWIAYVYGGGGLVGVLMGGAIADTVVSRTGDARWYARIAGIAAIAIFPLSTLLYLTSSPVTALMALLGTTMLMHVWMGPVYGTIQGLAGVRRRAIAVAINMLVINFLAYGFGPLLVGIASDQLRTTFGDQSLRYSIFLIVTITYSWAGIHFLLAAKTLADDLEMARS